MPRVILTDDQVIELVRQLPADRQAHLPRQLLARQWPNWVKLSLEGQPRMQAVAKARGR